MAKKKAKTPKKTAGTRAEVRAAGGIVVKRGKKGPKVMLVHRPRYRDWTFPKGKLDPGESFKDAAHREVLEETGFDCKLHRPKLPPLTYTDGSGRSKEVRYWLMTVKTGEFVPNDEVDMISWVRLPTAKARLSYSRDRAMYKELLDTGRIEKLLYG